MSYKRISPEPIAEGGTNATSMTNTFGVNYFDGTSIVTTTVGSATQVLTSNGAGLAPTFQAAGGGGGGVTGPGSSTDRSISTWNGTGGSALFDNPTTNINSAGIVTNTGQPSFLVYATQASTTPQTGNNAQVLILTANEMWTKLYDQTNSISTLGGGQLILTTPVAGTYLFTYNLLFSAAVTANSGAFCIASGSGSFCNDFAEIGAGGNYSMKGSIMVQLTAGDTVFFQMQIAGNGANDMPIDPTASLVGSTYEVFISGSLLC